jgi:hypothetical protein
LNFFFEKFLKFFWNFVQICCQPSRDVLYQILWRGTHFS